jgi:hypothetical protein
LTKSTTVLLPDFFPIQGNAPVSPATSHSKSSLKSSASFVGSTCSQGEVLVFYLAESWGLTMTGPPNSRTNGL